VQAGRELQALGADPGARQLDHEGLVVLHRHLHALGRVRGLGADQQRDHRDQEREPSLHLRTTTLVVATRLLPARSLTSTRTV
jgi:hypothetical protein